MRSFFTTFVLMALVASPVVAKDKKKKAKKPVRVALLMPEDLRNVVTIESSYPGFKNVDDQTQKHHGELGHYGHPPDDCEKDEIAVQINGIPGAICTAKCTDFLPCPKDVPTGVTAEPTCALQDQAGNHYCVLLCKPGKSKDGNLRKSEAGECGDATCQPAQGLGICTYDS